MRKSHAFPCRCPLCTRPPHLVALAAVALLTACTDAADDEIAPEPERFSIRPVQVQASSELPPECMESLLDAQAFYRERSVSMTLVAVDPSATSQLGIAVAGVIAVMPGKLATFPNRVHGETSYFHSVLGDILAAEVVLASCEVHTVVHELGHALMGPAHRNTRENVMHSELAQAGWVLDPDQLALIAD